MVEEVNAEKVCILTNAPISQNPRVVKEADSLSSVGYEVTVLYVQHALWTRVLDEEILKKSKWRGRAIRLEDRKLYTKITRFLVTFRSHFFRLLAHISFKGLVAEIAFCRVYLEQLFLAVKENAKFYIAHNPQALPVAATAARILKVRYAFDSEDFHTGEYMKNEHQCADYRMLSYLERKYLTECDYVSAASPGIGRELENRYDIKQPIVAMNVFPLADRVRTKSELDAFNGQSNRNLTLYWFSQIISLDRGLDDAVRAIALVKPVELHIRGHISIRERHNLNILMEETATTSRIYLHEPLPPSSLLDSIAEYDVGLCLERPEPLNRDICVTNKLFMYLLIGIPVIATNTTGQCEILRQMPAAGFVYQNRDHVALAKIINDLVEQPELVRLAGKAALTAAESRWNWETEQKFLINAVNRSFKKCLQ